MVNHQPIHTYLIHICHTPWDSDRCPLGSKPNGLPCGHMGNILIRGNVQDISLLISPHLTLQFWPDLAKGRSDPALTLQFWPDLAKRWLDPTLTLRFHPDSTKGRPDPAPPRVLGRRWGPEQARGAETEDCGLLLHPRSGVLLGLWLKYIVKVNEASEIKNRWVCIVGAYTSRLMPKGSQLIKN